LEWGRNKKKKKIKIIKKKKKQHKTQPQQLFIALDLKKAFAMGAPQHGT